MNLIANFGLVLAAIAVVPSAGAFTPAIFVSAVAAILGLIAIGFGHKRRGVMTIYLALSAAILSPALFDMQRQEIWLIVLTTVGTLLASLLYLDYRRSEAVAESAD
jgi:uncharacterized membrane protein